ncbi:hypothetical protein FN846DRAFT_788163 [Sphaerosporella brunnea]|uniref:Uncharacterized protein n=1 Tax=Sphaerosporella brunnea TaxID=1250544 RepID=A0A5J5EDF2_9PEZI|nr:hypothetical protein FN846DRAFT_788163 [Sphaerosporella brunnea]
MRLLPSTRPGVFSLAFTLNRRYSSASSSPPQLHINASRLRNTISEVTALSQPAPLSNPPSGPTPTGTSLLPPTISLRHYLTTSLAIPPIIDDIGSLFLPLPSLRPSAPTIALGGPLDASPLPLLAALEVLRTLRDNDVPLNHQLILIGWSCTSGSRFPRALLGSSVWAGLLGVEEAWNLRETSGEMLGRRTVKACLRESGWLGDLQQSLHLAAYFEAAPSSSPYAEVGLATGTGAWRWLDVTVTGGDALAAASRCILAARDVGTWHSASEVSTGVFEAANKGFAGRVEEVKFSVWIRAPNSQTVGLMHEECTAIWKEVCDEEDAMVQKVVTVMDEAQERFAATAVEAVREAVEDTVPGVVVGGRVQASEAMGGDGVRNGGGGEEVKREGLVDGVVDAVNTARRGVPTGVVTVPERLGKEAW